MACSSAARDLVQSGARLVDLLIQFRRVDFRQQLAGLHPVADIHIAPLNVSAGARQDGRFSERLDVAGENQRTGGSGSFHADHGNRGQFLGCGVGFRHQR